LLTTVICMRVALLACLFLGAASAHADSWQFQCDGTDPLLLAELEQAFESGIGYGETWDETVCNQGPMVLGDGVRLPKTPEQIAAANEAKAAKAAAAAAEAARIEAAKPKLTPLQQKMEDQFFALFIPVFVFFAGGFAVLLAAVIAVLLRTRKQIVVDVSCPSCQMRIPFVVGESPHLFCPSCGGACRVSVETTGKSHSALAIPL
jgi:hypothetical protein